MSVKILDQRPSSRDPEVKWTIREDEKGYYWCDCPACEHGGECYHMMRVRSQKEYEIQLRVKMELLKNTARDYNPKTKAQIIAETWAYIDAQNAKRLAKEQEQARALVAREEAARMVDFLNKGIITHVPQVRRRRK